ncbi:MAG TPA: MaoC family dehydratase [Bryobacteraceae bacterium]|nr:MaoC family dehydratase [Bryobacteraceae bacterium]
MPNPRVVNGLDELRTLVGQEVGVSDWLTITQEMINRFADATDDHQWIHVDVERAQRESRFGTTIAHGFLTVSLLPRLSQEAVQVQGDFKMRVNYGFNRLRFVSPVPAGARIRARFAPQKVTDNEVTWLVTVDVEGSDKPAIVAEWLGRFY